MKKYLFLFAVLVNVSAVAQVKIGDNPTVINGGSLLEMESSNKGVLFPRVDLYRTWEWGLAGIPEQGMVVYNKSAFLTSSDFAPALPGNIGLYYWDGTRWVGLKGVSAQAGDFWGLLGNAGTKGNYNGTGGSGGLIGAGGYPGAPVRDFNFLGTTDDQNLLLATNNTVRAVFNRGGSLFGGSGYGYNPYFETRSSIIFGAGNTDSSGESVMVGTNNLNVFPGFGSIMGGLSNYNKGVNSIVSGSSNFNEGSYNIVSGKFNVATKYTKGSLVIGESNALRLAAPYVPPPVMYDGDEGPLNANLVTGFNNKIEYNGTKSSINNIVSGNSNLAIGSFNSVFGSLNSSDGNDNVVGGSSNSIKGNNSSSFGTFNEVNANASFAFGGLNRVNTGHEYSVVFGESASTTNSRQFVARFNNGYQLYSGAATGVTLNAGAGTWTSISDYRSKSHIQTIDYGLAAVMQLKPSSYNYIGTNRVSFGFVAQDVQTIVPEIVDQTQMGPDKDYLGVRYVELIPILTKAIQEQQKQIEELKMELSKIKKNQK